MNVGFGCGAEILNKLKNLNIIHYIPISKLFNMSNFSL